MTTNRSKIRCPKCNTVYSIDDRQFNVTGKKSAKCLACGSRFFVENRECLKTSDAFQSGVAFLQSYFEKRCGSARRKVIDRRKDVIKEFPSLNEFPHDIIPIFSSEGNSIIGHISPGRRERADRRSGTERRQPLMAQYNSGGELLPEYRLDGSRSMQIDN
jgi:predicted Zn finger-like uncharacterized protein